MWAPPLSYLNCARVRSQKKNFLSVKNPVILYPVSFNHHRGHRDHREKIQITLNFLLKIK
jgi:hypothetical protein